MRRLAVAALPVALFAVALAGLPALAVARRHRVHLPPPNLPHALTVDEREWAVQPSKTLVGAGTVTFNAYNRGQDDHNFVIVDAAGNVLGKASLKPGASAAVTAHMAPGRYVLFCSLFQGTPESHYARGMHTTLLVR